MRLVHCYDSFVKKGGAAHIRPYKKRSNGPRRIRFIVSDHGFTTVELVVVIIVIALLIAALFPAMSSLISDARLEGAKQDAASIGAAIELLKIEGEYDPGDIDLYDKVCEMCGVHFRGMISDLQADGGFLYTVTAGEVSYMVRYDTATGDVYTYEAADA